MRESSSAYMLQRPKIELSRPAIYNQIRQTRRVIGLRVFIIYLFIVGLVQKFHRLRPFCLTALLPTATSLNIIINQRFQRFVCFVCNLEYSGPQSQVSY